jgi:hypothetical protein
MVSQLMGLWVYGLQFSDFGCPSSFEISRANSGVKKLKSVLKIDEIF